MGHGDLGWGAGVPQVVLVDLPPSGADCQADTVQREVHRGERTLHTDRRQDSADTQTGSYSFRQLNLKPSGSDQVDILLSVVLFLPKFKKNTRVTSGLTGQSPRA